MAPPPTEAPELAPGDVIAGKFRLERVIGRGGMGSVWAARQVQLDMPVALKFIETEDGVDIADARVRFEREARAAGQIRSPHVVQILDHGVDGERPYIVMELLEGEDLGARLRREKRIGLHAASRIVAQAAKALKRAHEAGIIHRDLKPGNVFLARFDDDEIVKILDFGVAKIRRAGSLDEAAATRLGIVFGSPSYMSPEQARGAQSIDHRTDLWSLAVILYRAITGVKPFQAESLADLVVKVCIDPLPVATRHAPDLPPSVDAFFERAFARDPAQRFTGATELAAAFEAAIATASAFDPRASCPAPPVSQPIAIAAPPTPMPGAFAPLPIGRGGASDPTPSSGMSALPSGGWGFGPASVPAPGTAPPPPGPALGPPPGPSAGAPSSTPARAPAPAPGPSRAAVVFAACMAAATLLLAFVALVTRGRSSPAPAASTSAPTPAEVEATPPPTPLPLPSSVARPALSHESSAPTATASAAAPRSATPVTPPSPSMSPSAPSQPTKKTRP